MKAENKQHRKRTAIDFLRVIATLIIVGYYHVFNYTDAFQNFNNFISWGLTLIPVGLFALISGYLVGIRKKFTSLKEILSFYSKRVVRIYPLYLLALILFLVLDIDDFTTVAKAAILLSMFLPPAPSTLWFITIIILFYLISPLLVNLSDNVANYLITCALIFLLLLGYLYIHELDIRIMLYFPAFALGILFAKFETWFLKLNLGVVTLLFVISLGFSFIQFNSWTITTFKVLPMLVTGSLAIMIFALKAEHRLPDSKWIKFLSYSSLSMYMFHRVIYKAMIDIYFPANDLFQVLYLFGVCFPVVILVSWLIQKTYEQIIFRIFYRIS